MLDDSLVYEVFMKYELDDSLVYEVFMKYDYRSVPMRVVVIFLSIPHDDSIHEIDVLLLFVHILLTIEHE